MAARGLTTACRCAGQRVFSGHMQTNLRQALGGDSCCGCLSMRGAPCTRTDPQHTPNERPVEVHLQHTRPARANTQGLLDRGPGPL